jgi:hypothetical protein
MTLKFLPKLNNAGHANTRRISPDCTQNTSSVRVAGTAGVLWQKVHRFFFMNTENYFCYKAKSPINAS